MDEPSMETVFQILDDIFAVQYVISSALYVYGSNLRFGEEATAERVKRSLLETKTRCDTAIKRLDKLCESSAK